MRKSVVAVTAVAGVAAALAVTKSRAALKAPDLAPAEWPPLAPAPKISDTSSSTTSADNGVEPIDGACPDGYPIKAKKSSSIYHSPGGRNYERTIPDRCYASAEAAEAAGYRAPKS